MSTLRIISEEVPPAVFALSPGRVSIGRAEDNGFQVNHPTVSGRHCELSFAEGRLTVKDLSSTNGTFVNDQRVCEETAVEAGQILRLGEVRLRYEAAVKARIHVTPPRVDGSQGGSGAAVRVRPVESGSTAPRAMSGEQRAEEKKACHRHAQAEGKWICTRCHTVFCDACSGRRVAGEKTWHRCSLCMSKVVSLEEYQAQQKAMAVRSGLRLAQRLGSAFTYPFAKGGVLFLILGTIVFWLVDVAKMIVGVVPFYGVVAMAMLLIFSWGWLFAYSQKIISACSNDEDVLPDWPEISEWMSDLVQPFCAFLGTLGVCFGPALVFSYYSGKYDFAPFLFYALFLLGVIYLPMALLVVSLTGSVRSANPFVVLPAIMKAPKDYAIVCVFFMGGLGLWNGLWLLVQFLGPEGKGASVLLKQALWQVGWCLPLGFVFLYCMVVCLRVLGMMYRCNWRRFGWFRH